MLEKLCTLEEESLTYFNCDFQRQICFSMVPAPFVFLQFSSQHWTGFESEGQRQTHGSSHCVFPSVFSMSDLDRCEVRNDAKLVKAQERVSTRNVKAVDLNATSSMKRYRIEDCSYISLELFPADSTILAEKKPKYIAYQVEYWLPYTVLARDIKLAPPHPKDSCRLQSKMVKIHCFPRRSKCYIPKMQWHEQVAVLPIKNMIPPKIVLPPDPWSQSFARLYLCDYPSNHGGVTNLFLRTYALPRLVSLLLLAPTDLPPLGSQLQLE